MHHYSPSGWQALLQAQADHATQRLPSALVYLPAGAAVADEAAAGAAAGELQVYVNSQQQYKLSVPAGWDRKDKAGAAATVVRPYLNAIIPCSAD